MMGMGFRRIALAQGLLDMAVDRDAALEARYARLPTAGDQTDTEELLQCSKAKLPDLPPLRH